MPHRGIRWDRIARTALLLVLAGIVLLYIGPARTWVGTYAEAKRKREDVAALRGQNDRLRALRDPGALEREARRLGMVRVGERSYVIENLP